MKSITSSQNPLVKETKLIRDRKYKQDKSLFIIEGTRFVEEAMKSGVAINRILCSESFLSANGNLPVLKSADFEQYSLPDRLFNEIADTESPQGILAVVGLMEQTLDRLPRGAGLFIILETIQDPGNMGTIIRTADAAGFTGVICSKGCVDVFNPKVLRSTMGSIFHIPVIVNCGIKEAIAELKASGVKIYAAHLDGNTAYFSFELNRNSAFIIGNEAKGISTETALMADSLIKIPMPGQAESLNASVAAAVLMYESVRQRSLC